MHTHARAGIPDQAAMFMSNINSGPASGSSMSHAQLGMPY